MFRFSCSEAGWLVMRLPTVAMAALRGLSAYEQAGCDAVAELERPMAGCSVVPQAD
jgi:hypothetical protein